MRPRCSRHSSAVSRSCHGAKSCSTETSVGLLRLIRDQSSVRRPIRIRAIVLIARVIQSTTAGSSHPRR